MLGNPLLMRRKTTVNPIVGVRMLFQPSPTDTTSTYLTDATGKTITYAGTVSLDDDAPFAGTRSILLTGTTDSRCLIGVAADTAIGTGDFTMEAWYKGTDSSGYILSNSGTIYTNSFRWGEAGDGGLTLRAGFGLLVGSGSIWRNGTWHHVAVVRNGNVITQYVDGVVNASTIISATITIAGAGKFSIGVDMMNTAYSLSGRVACVRVSESAVYTAAFTPPTGLFPTV